MPRRLTIPSAEMGPVELYLIYEYDGTWEEEWQPLQGAMDLPVVTRAVIEHALKGWTRPLADNLGPPPKGQLRRLPSRRCALEKPEDKKPCPLHDERRCLLLSSKMPWCFEPNGISPGNLAGEIVKLWRQEVYVVVVQEPNG